jgi:hypothetical protein
MNKTRVVALLVGLGVAVGLYGLLVRPSDAPAPNPPSQSPPVVQSETPAAGPAVTPPAAPKPPTTAFAPKKGPTAPLPPVAQTPPSPPAPTPVAALGSNTGQPSIGAQSQNPPAENPNSLSGWGPWASPPGSTSAGPTSSPDGTPSMLGQNPTVNAAAETPPPAVLPTGSGPPQTSPPGTSPPGTSSNIRPGHGWGDRNHTHIHRRDK